LQERYGALKASLVVGFLHALWHLPIFLIVNGPVASGPFNPVQFVQNVLTIMVITLIWTWGFNSTNQSILIAVLLHSSGNAVGPLISTWIPEFPAQAQYTVPALYVVIALAVVILTKGKLSYKPVDS
jgi:membrane protease YdiL (CAAX protease family)